MQHVINIKIEAFSFWGESFSTVSVTAAPPLPENTWSLSPQHKAAAKQTVLPEFFQAYSELCKNALTPSN